MIVNDRITDYIRSLESSQGSLLDSIEQEAERERVPIIRRETAALLRTLVAALRPAHILEIGTDGILLSSHVPCDAGKLPHHHH